MTYKTGTIGEFMRWTKRVIAEPAAAAKVPKRWFDSERTAERARAAKTSPEAMVKLLSSQNLRLLHLIATKQPGSVRELATLVRRKESNLSRTLKKLEQVGIIALQKGPGRTRAPRLVARRVTLELDLAGADRRYTASVHRSSARS
jgi:predicted transcriptional regulator